MNYTNIVVGLATKLSNDARVFTRYNYPVDNLLEVGRIELITRRTKFVVVDLDQTTTSFNVRFLQLGNETIVPTPEYCLDKFQQDQSFGNALKQFSAIADAVEYAGLDHRYTTHFSDIFEMAQERAVKGNVIIAACNAPNATCVTLLAQSEECTVVIQLME